jgi:glycosyltransferase involved in cell wall biosynthesis
LIVGDGELRGPLEKQAGVLRISDRVVFAGTRYDLQNMLASIDISALASVEKEGLPVILVQSALAGKPVVMTDVAGVSEIIRDGETGYLVPPGDAAAFAKALLAALGNPEEAKRRAAAARDLAAREFDVRNTTAQMDEVYEELMAAGNRK